MIAQKYKSFLLSRNWKKNRNKGFSLVEAVAGMLIVTITISVSGKLFAQQRQQNISNEIRNGAVALSQNILDEIRLDFETQSLGQTSRQDKSLGISYDSTINICTAKPSVNSNGSVICSTEDTDKSARYILVQINNNGKKVYTIETLYTKVR